MNFITFLIAVFSLLAFIIFAVDKPLSKARVWRIPEVVLLVIACVGGAAGALAAMCLFRHKTNKKTFTTTIPLAMLLHLVVLILLFCL